MAILFLADIDNLLFAIMLPERHRARIEVVGRVELGEDEEVALAFTRQTHTVLILVAVLGAVLLGGAYGDDGFFATGLFAFLAFWVGGVVQARATGHSTNAEACNKIGRTTCASMLGAAGFGLLAFLSAALT